MDTFGQSEFKLPFAIFNAVKEAENDGESDCDTMAVDSDEGSDDIVCAICSQGGRLLLCDGCDDGCAMGPPLCHRARSTHVALPSQRVAVWQCCN